MQLVKILSIFLILSSACSVHKKNKTEVATEHNHDAHEHVTEDNHYNNMSAPVASDKLEQQGIKELFANYFQLKDGFVMSDKQIILNYAGGLYRTIKAIDKKDLELKLQSVWLNQMKSLERAATEIANERDVAKQRKTFIELSKAVYALAKVASISQPFYYQHYKNDNESEAVYWLSLDKEIRNPYYGSEMLLKGTIIETLHTK